MNPSLRKTSHVGNDTLKGKLAETKRQIAAAHKRICKAEVHPWRRREVPKRKVQQDEN